MDEQGLEETLLVRHQEMVHDAVAEIGGEDFAGLGPSVTKQIERPGR